MDNRPVAIYVHGLASGAAGGSCGALSELFPQFAWIATDFGEDLRANVEKLNQMVVEYNPQLLVGTSMGGLTVIYADAPDAVKVVCNPALSVADCVRNTIGLGVHNYFCTRIDGVKSFVLTEDMCRDWERYIATHIFHRREDLVMQYSRRTTSYWARRRRSPRNTILTSAILRL